MTSPMEVMQQALRLPSSAFDEPALINPGPGVRFLPPPEDDELPRKGSGDLMGALKALGEAQGTYDKAEQFYDGEIGDTFASEVVKALLAQSGVGEIEDFNYAAVPVDAVAEDLQIRSVTPVAGEDSVEESDQEVAAVEQATERAEEAVELLRRRNQLDAEETLLHLEVSKLGDAYLFVWPVTEEVDPEGEEEVDPDRVAGPVERVVAVDMFVNSARAVRVFYDEENPLRKTYAVKSWQWHDPDTDSDRQRATLYYPDRIERWVTGPDEAPDREDSWSPYLTEEGEQWPIPNPTGRIPFFHFRTRRNYGLPEHIRAYGPQRLINKLILTHAATVDYQGFPQRYALLNPKSDDVMANMIDPDFPEDDDDDPEGDGHSQLRADPAAVWKLPGVSGVGQFAAADPMVFMGPLERYIKAVAELTSTPLHRFVGYSQPPSGESLRVSDKPHVTKIKSRQNDYGAAWEDAYEFALGLLGLDDITVHVEWQPTQIAAGLEDWNIVQAKIANGVPVRQALTETGYPPDQVESWLADETGADLTRRVALLNSIGTAVQALGAGVGLGVVSQAQVADIVSRVLGLAGEQLPALDAPVEVSKPAPPPALPPGGGPPGQGAKPGGAAAATGLPPLPPPPPPIQVGQGSPAPAREE
jgi:hypothetical protein